MLIIKEDMEISILLKEVSFLGFGAITGTVLGFLLIEYINDITIKIIALFIWICYKALLRIISKEDITGEAIGEMNEILVNWNIFGGMSSDFWVLEEEVFSSQ